MARSMPHISSLSTCSTRANMAPHLADSQRNLVHDMIVGSSHTARTIADIAIAVLALSSSFAPTSVPSERQEHHGMVMAALGPSLLQCSKLLREHFIEKPHQYLDEMAVFLGRISSPCQNFHHQKNPEVDQMDKETLSSGRERSKCRPPRLLPAQLVFILLLPTRMRRRVWL